MRREGKHGNPGVCVGGGGGGKLVGLGTGRGGGEETNSGRNGWEPGCGGCGNW